MKCLFNGNRSVNLDRVNTLIDETVFTSNPDSSTFIFFEYGNSVINNTKFHDINLKKQNSYLIQVKGNNFEFKGNEVHDIKFDSIGAILDVLSCNSLLISNNSFRNNLVGNTYSTMGIGLNIKKTRIINISNNSFVRVGAIDCEFVFPQTDRRSYLIYFDEDCDDLVFESNNIYLGLNLSGISSKSSFNNVTIVNNQVIGILWAFKYLRAGKCVFSGNLISSTYRHMAGIVVDSAFNNTLDKEYGESTFFISYENYDSRKSIVLNNLMPYYYRLNENFNFPYPVFKNNCIPINRGYANFYYEPEFVNPVRFNPISLYENRISESTLDSLEQIILEADYSLKEGSPAIDAGISVASTNYFNKDAYGNERVQNKAIDLGAVESSFVNKSDKIVPDVVDRSYDSTYIMLYSEQPDELIVDLDKSEQIITGDSTYLHPVYMGGGTNPFLYTWNADTVNTLRYLAKPEEQVSKFVLRVEDFYGCTTSDSITIYMFDVGINKRDVNPAIQMFPSGFGHIKVLTEKSIVEEASLEVYDINGRKLEHIVIPAFENEAIVKTKSLTSKGMFVVKLVSGTLTLTKKVLIQ